MSYCLTEIEMLLTTIRSSQFQTHCHLSIRWVFIHQTIKNWIDENQQNTVKLWISKQMRVVFSAAQKLQHEWDWQEWSLCLKFLCIWLTQFFHAVMIWQVRSSSLSDLMWSIFRNWMITVFLMWLSAHWKNIFFNRSVSEMNCVWQDDDRCLTVSQEFFQLLQIFMFLQSMTTLNQAWELSRRRTEYDDWWLSVIQKIRMSDRYSFCIYEKNWRCMSVVWWTLASKKKHFKIVDEKLIWCTAFSNCRTWFNCQN